MKKIITIALALISAPAFAHSGHTHEVDGHSHTLFELALMGGMPAVLAIAGIGAVVYLLKRRND